MGNLSVCFSWVRSARLRYGMGGLFIALLMLGAAGASFADTIYNVNLSFGGTGTATGTITTDGNLGVLSATDTTNWNLTISDGVHPSVNLTSGSAGSSKGSLGMDLTSTATNLLFSFTNVDNGYFFLSDNGGFLCFGPGNGVCAISAPGNIEGIDIVVGGQNFYTNSTETGTQVIATVAPSTTTPEPSSLILLFVGAPVLLIRFRSAFQVAKRLQ
jgi:hypothetical protein